MSPSNTGPGRLNRLFWGFAGATVAVGPTFVVRLLQLWSGESWNDELSDEGLKWTVMATDFMAVVILFIGWMGALVLSYTEPEPHVWNVFFKAAGVPAIIVGAGHIFQIS